MESVSYYENGITINSLISGYASVRYILILEGWYISERASSY
jgi:hypothetical protein